jgi:hypothetical protein
MPQAWKYARVTYDAATAGIVAAKLVGWAAMGGAGAERGPGFTQNEAVQFATFLAYMRHSIASNGGQWGWFAQYGPGDRFLGTELIPTHPGWTHVAQSYLPIVGDEPVPPWRPAFREVWSESNPSPTWGKQLVLAIDRVLTQIAHSEQGGEVPLGYGPQLPGEGAVTAAFPVLGALIVGGVAVTVIGAAAAWRYLDPQVRVRAAEVTAAARAYQNRLENAAASGVMAPPSPLEVANAAAVGAAADEQAARYWGYGAAALAGIGGGAALSP